MDHAMNRKTQLLSTCGAAALAIGTVLLPTLASAQAIQATPTIVQGAVTIDSSVANQDTVTVGTFDAVVDWTPLEDSGGDALDFLPSTGTVIFQGDTSGQSFAIINRILPATNGNVTVIDGTVISQLQQVSGPPVTGGHVLFYSPTGLLIGANAAFDVGSLVLTTLAPDITTFSPFTTADGPLVLIGVANDQSAITISPGATIDALEQGSYFLVAAPRIEMGGTAFVNGSTAYVAGQEMTLAHASGLFDITINVGSNELVQIVHSGTTGGPASTGAGDNHVIYGVANGQSNAYSTMFSGNLGFDPAVSALIENGVVILSANFAVSGTQVINDQTTGTLTSATLGQVLVENAQITSDTFIHASNFAQVAAGGGITRIDGDLYLYGRENAQIVANGTSGQVNITGTATVTASVNGNSFPFANNPADLDGLAGDASIAAVDGGTVRVDGDALVLAIGVMGLDSGNLVAGNAEGGSATVHATSGTVTLNGNLGVNASALPTSSSLLYNSGGNAVGGFAALGADSGGTVTVQGDTAILAHGLAMNLLGPGDTLPVGNGTSGTIEVAALSGGLIDLNGNLDVLAHAAGSNAINSAGGDASGNLLSILATEGSTLDVSGALVVQSQALGGESTDGAGGVASGTQINIDANLGSHVVAATVDVSATAVGGNGITGGGTAPSQLMVTVDGSDSSFSAASYNFAANSTGGNGTTGNGGGAGGGNINLTAQSGGEIFSTGNFTATSQGTGGTSISGNGGNASGGSIDLRLDGGTLDMALSTLTLFSGGTGGAGNNGGNGTAGTARVDLLNAGLLRVNDLFATGAALGGVGTGGNGGLGTGATESGGGALIDLAGDSQLIAGGNVELIARATGGVSTGVGGNSGNATGGTAQVNITTSLFNVTTGLLRLQTIVTGGDAQGTGGDAGSAIGGIVRLNVRGGAVANVGDLQARLSLAGGNASAGEAGDAESGTVFVTVQDLGSSLAVGALGRPLILAEARGGLTTGNDGNGGYAIGGNVTVRVGDSATFTLAPIVGTPDLQPEIASLAIGGGTNVEGGIGGPATAGTVTLNIFGSGQLTAGFLNLGAISIGGAGFGSANVIGGDAFGGLVSLQVTTGGTLDTALLAQNSRIGGQGVGTGAAGSALTGSVTVNIDSATANLSGQSAIIATGVGGTASGSGAGGNAQSGNVSVNVTNAGSLLFNEAGSLLALRSSAVGGDGASGGNAGSGQVDLQVQGSTLTGVDLVVDSVALAGNNPGDTAAGDATTQRVQAFFRTGTTATIGTLAMNATATSFNTGAATSGTAQLVVENSGSSLTLNALSVIADANVPLTGTGTAGTFLIDVLTLGTLTTGTLNARAIDINNPALETQTSRVQALDGVVHILTQGDFETSGNLSFEASGDGLIQGGANISSITADINARVAGLLSFSGTNPALPTLEGANLFLTSGDIEINPGAQVKAQALYLESTATAFAATLGGATNGPGYSLTQNEFGRIRTGSTSFSAPVTANTADFDIEIRDLDLFGTLVPDGAGSSVNIYTPGSIQVSGQLRYASAAPTDIMSIYAGERLEVLLPTGSIGVFGGSAGSGPPPLAGTLNLGAAAIFAADANLLGLIRSDPDAAALAGLLADNTGVTTDGSFIFANRVEIAADSHILTKNTGVGATFSGIIVGPGGLLIRRELDFGAGTMRVVTFGGRLNADGTSTINDDFFALVDFGTSTPAVDFTTDATLNDCNIVLGQCAAPPPPPPEREFDLPITSVDYVEPQEPVTDDQIVGKVEEDVIFGMEFPQALNPPPVGDQGVVDDPVTSGGDSAAYGREEEEEE